MTTHTPNYITPEGLEKLRAEYHQLFRVERPQVVKTVAWAASNGDRSENADYIYGKRRLRQIDSRLHFLSKRIAAVEIVDPKTIKSDRIVFGATVTLLDEDENCKTYQIVGEDESNGNEGKISWKSPIARALLGKKVDDEVKIIVPSGEIYLVVIKFEYR